MSDAPERIDPPEVIYLQPYVDDPDTGRMWCEDDDPAGLGEPWTKYLHVDTVRALAAERDALRAQLQTAREALEEIRGDAELAWDAEPTDWYESVNDTIKSCNRALAALTRAGEEIGDETWTCPECAFRFGAEHEDEGGGYSCPNCAEAALRAQRDNYRESMGRLASLAKGLAAQRDALRRALAASEGGADGINKNREADDG